MDLIESLHIGSSWLDNDVKASERLASDLLCRSSAIRDIC